MVAYLNETDFDWSNSFCLLKHFSIFFAVLPLIPKSAFSWCLMFRALESETKYLDFKTLFDLKYSINNQRQTCFVKIANFILSDFLRQLHKQDDTQPLS